MDQHKTFYDVVMADPPWRYDFSKSRSRKIERKYPTMSVEEIIALKDSIPFAKNCALYLWVTQPKLKLGLQVMDGWGFEYKSGIIWDKKRVGMGYWARGRHEQLLIGTRGKKRPPKPKDRPQSVIEEVRSNTHSRKPIAAYEIIEKAFPNDKKLELFARVTREGWDSWGNQAPQSIQLENVAVEFISNSVLGCQTTSSGGLQDVLVIPSITGKDTTVNSTPSTDQKTQE